MGKQSIIGELIDADHEKFTRGIEELKWAFPITSSVKHRGNVSVKTGNGGFIVAFRKGTAKKFKSDRIVFAVDGARIYFAENDNGYKLCTTSNPRSETREIRTRHDIADFIGDYVLRYDGDKRLYHIDKKNRTGEGY